MKPYAFSNTALNVLRETHTPTLEKAKQYVARGWAVTPVQFESKQPILREWQAGGVSEEALDQHFGSEPVNIAIVLGDPSHGLVDIDIDHPDALRFAPKLLPETNCVFGRQSMPSSHWLYQVPSRRKAFVFQ